MSLVVLACNGILAARAPRATSGRRLRPSSQLRAQLVHSSQRVRYRPRPRRLGRQTVEVSGGAERAAEHKRWSVPRSRVGREVHSKLGRSTIKVSGGADRAAESKFWSVCGRRRKCGGEYGAGALAATMIQPPPRKVRGSSPGGGHLLRWPLPNHSLHRTCYSGLRPLPHAGELKR